jgi:aminodeoxyfutalosine deaminase
LKKISATQLFDGYHLYGKEYILLINDDNEIIDLLKPDYEITDVQVYDGLVTPGLINCHCHTELSCLYQRIPQQTGLVPFLLHVVNKRQQGEQVQEAISQAFAAMQADGIVAVGDICNTNLSILAKQQTSIVSKNFIEVAGFVPNTAQDRFDQGKKIAQAFWQNNLWATVVPHAPYSTSHQLLQLISNQEAFISSIHFKETAEEENWLTQKKGSFQNLYNQLGVNTNFYVPNPNSWLKTYLANKTEEENIILVHNVSINEEDVAIAKQSNKNIYFCLCPGANKFINNVQPSVSFFIKNNLPLVLGTDSLASNTKLSIQTEVEMLWEQCQNLNEKLIILQAATSQGAKALQLDNKLGSFKKGKQPHIVYWNNKKLVP